MSRKELKGRWPTPYPIRSEAGNYIFLAEQVRVLPSHMPPAFLQSAWVLAAVTSPVRQGR